AAPSLLLLWEGVAIPRSAEQPATEAMFVLINAERVLDTS
ncbi:hypothetical protein GBAR_LOCUS16861, partial [Geodia barretti]